LCCDCFICIILGILVSGLSSKVCCLNVWPTCFVSQFLWTTINSLSRPTLQISKGGVFSFFCLCCKVCIPYKVNINERRLCVSFDNSFNFAQYSKMFSLLQDACLLLHFLNGGHYSFMEGFLFASIILLHLQCSLIFIFKFLFQLWYTNKFLPILSIMIVTFLK